MNKIARLASLAMLLGSAAPASAVVMDFESLNQAGTGFNNVGAL